MQLTEPSSPLQARITSAKPVDSSALVPIRISTLAKIHMVVTFLESKEDYKPGVSEDAFIKSNLSFLGTVDIPNYFKEYLSAVYAFHVRSVSPDVVYEETDGHAFASLANALIKIRQAKPSMTPVEFEYELVRGYPLGGGASTLKKPKWVNWIRKTIDWIDDHW